MAKQSLRLKVNGSRVSAELARGARVIWAGEAGYSGMDDLAEVIARLAVEPELVSPRTRVRVDLERPVVQSRVLHDLPPVPEASLRQLVEQQAHRYFRKNGKPLVVDAGYVSRSDHRKGVYLAATEAPVVSAIRDGVRAAGLLLDDVVPADPAASVSLLPPDERLQRFRARRLSLARLGISAAVCWVIAGAVIVLSTTAQRRSVDRALQQLAEPVAALTALQREIAVGSAMNAALDADARRRGVLIEFLAAVTQAVPDSAFLTSLSVDSAGRGFFGGFARRSSEVVARLERSGVMRTPRLEVQPGREVIGGIELERFSIAFGEAVP